MKSYHLPFMGEDMTCLLCGIQALSDARLESNWRALSIPQGVFYACPAHFPAHGGSKEDYEVAYICFLIAVMEKLKQSGATSPAPITWGDTGRPC